MGKYVLQYWVAGEMGAIVLHFTELSERDIFINKMLRVMSEYRCYTLQQTFYSGKLK